MIGYRIHNDHDTGQRTALPEKNMKRTSIQRIWPTDDRFEPLCLENIGLIEQEKQVNSLSGQS